jgi:glycosyltransferase involved in cell wall biosynthesis
MPRIVFALTVPMSIGHYGQVLSLLRQRGWDVHVVTGEPVGAVGRLPCIAYHHVAFGRRISPFHDVISLVRLLRLFVRLRPDIVVAATPKASLLALLSARAAGVKHRLFHVWGCRWDAGAGLRSMILRHADRVACLCASKVVPVSRSLGELLVRHRLVKSFDLIESGGTKGVDLEIFSPSGPRMDFEGSPVIGFVGRVARDKGAGSLPQLAASLRRSFPRVQLVVVGDLDAADPLDASEVESLRRDPSIRMLGQVRDVAGAMRAMDLLCFPSIREGLPNAVMEAAACGVPTVAWDATGTRDAVVDGVTGILIPPGDISAMSQALISLLADDSRRRTMGDAAREHVSRNWEENRVLHGFVRYLEEACR